MSINVFEVAIYGLSGWKMTLTSILIHVDHNNFLIQCIPDKRTILNQSWADDGRYNEVKSKWLVPESMHNPVLLQWKNSSQSVVLCAIV